MSGAVSATEDLALSQLLQQSNVAQANSSEPLHFDIPTQPRAARIAPFAVISGRAALFSSTLVVGRTASPPRDSYMPLDALHREMEHDMEMMRVSSSAMTAVEYDPISQWMKIQFKQGDVHDFCRVPQRKKRSHITNAKCMSVLPHGQT